MAKYPSDHYYEYAASGVIVCGDCLNTDLERTRRGEYTGDEAVRIGMFTRMHDDETEPYQCDGCCKQNDIYEELGGYP